MVITLFYLSCGTYCQLQFNLYIYQFLLDKSFNGDVADLTEYKKKKNLIYIITKLSRGSKEKKKKVACLFLLTIILIGSIVYTLKKRKKNLLSDIIYRFHKIYFLFVFIIYCRSKHNDCLYRKSSAWCCPYIFSKQLSRRIYFGTWKTSFT